MEFVEEVRETMTIIMVQIMMILKMDFEVFDCLTEELQGGIETVVELVISGRTHLLPPALMPSTLHSITFHLLHLLTLEFQEVLQG